MTTALARLRALSDTQLAGAAVVLGVAWLASLALVGEGPAAVQVAQVLLGAILAPTLAIVVGVRLVAAPLALTVRLRRLLQATAIVGVVALALTANSFVVGGDDSEAGRTLGLFASLTTVFLLTSVLGFAAAIALVLFVLIRRRLPVRASIAIAVPLGAVAAPFVAVTLLGPGAVIAVSLVVFVYTLLPRLGRAFRLPTTAPASVAVEPVRDRVILLAALSLAVTVVVWAVGIAVSVANTGTDAATSGLGVASAAGQLAVVPLLWAVSSLLAFWLPQVAVAARRGCAVASVIVVVAVIAMIATYSSAGDGYVPLVGVLSVGIGVWAACIVWALWASWPPPARLAMGGVTAMGATVVYAMVAALSGGIVLALVSGFLAFGGARRLLRARRTAAAPA
ncbi:hypothetical protein [Conyzicola sp.]|uniref:hypothetical protein n=1 Tax=Conyzicola sp. TaxID=1969404 RepID=UPI00398A0744